MQLQWYIDELRKKIDAVLKDKGSSFDPMIEMTEYIGKRLTSDSAQFYAMKAREEGGTTLQIIEAAFYGAFGTKPERDTWVRLNSEGQSSPDNAN